MTDGRELTVALSGKRVVDALVATHAKDAEERLARFTTAAKVRVWVSPAHVTAVEDRPDPA